MKKLLLLVTFITVFTIISKAQSRIGYTPSQIKAEFYYYTWSSGYTSDGAYYISANTTRGLIGYYFSTELICNSCILIPKTSGDLNYWVELYNTNYVIVSDKEWKAYLTNGSIVHIKLEHSADSGSYFYYY